MDGLLIQRASRVQLLLAGAAALLILLALVAASPRASLPLPAVVPFMPMCALTVFTTAGIAAYLLGAQFHATRQPMLGALSGAYAFTALAVALQLLMFPGVFTPAGLFGANPHSAAWMWVYWHGGFPFFVIVAVLARDRLQARLFAARQAGWWKLVLVGGPVLAAALLGLLAVHTREAPDFGLPDHVVGVIAYRTATVVWLLNALAVTIVILGGRLRAVLDLWLAIAVLACFTDTTLNLLSPARFTLGWYLARLFSMLAPGVLVCALVWEVTALYGRLFAAHASLLQASMHDALTGVYNRSYFDVEYRRELERSAHGGQQLSLLMIDVDDFKRYNDTYGHWKGDQCLAAVAHALASVVRRGPDFVARYGGEEFALVLPATDEQAALAVAERARQAVARLRLEVPAGIGHVTVSVGCATRAVGASDPPEQLIQAADAALYEAKSAGRNCVRFAEAPA
ncbi:hypothetical protein BKK79_06445 [Cupriavidus sp. USMAA2-4]|uniref:sensor domain-containing diguanylate cyclase n=1 Tax=unclassified Cupriavidus TaxID=2640874 RepID=UPI0008A676CD|nr:MULTISPECIES: sensor domain-containing diguanylate cyclase [unclassified Cupriavidus]AOY91497.1 hypothetical protein BKK79_06445 [Cupriavidus sp. USMAA2-4]AOY98957.1 hypothetical protein BKK81_06565 [Cupriavidus sp. USMAHM13]